MHKLIILLAATVFSVFSYQNANAQSNKSSTVTVQDVKQQTLKMELDGKTFTILLENNVTAKALLQTLPFSISASVYHNNHYYAVTPKSLPINGLKPTKDATKGGIYYSAEYKGLGIFFEGGHFDNNELFYIGKIKEDISSIDGSKNALVIKFEK